TTPARQWCSPWSPSSPATCRPAAPSASIPRPRCARIDGGGGGRSVQSFLGVQRDVGPAPIGVHLSMPDGLRLPIDDLIAAHDRVLRTGGRSALEYGGNQGYLGLREWIAADHSAKESVPVGARGIVLTSGASGGLKDLCAALIDAGDVILTEQPTFSGSLRTLAASGAEIV